jgi:glutamate N-acetyltransferase/amino-acid N-acetyltransferase
MRDAKKMAALTAQAVAAVYDRRYSKIQPNDVLVCSTGRIGILMPMRNVERGIRACAPLLARSTRTDGEVARAIMTSDTRPKEIAVEFQVKGRSVRIGGVCKGAGMIQPLMNVATVRQLPGRRVVTPRRSRAAIGHATMLAFITSDVAITGPLLRAALTDAVNQSFNRISVDGDMSTNDSVIALTNGLARNQPIRKRDSAFRDFQDAITMVCVELAKMIVHDGEGVSRFVTLRIHNARSAADAEKAARTIADSSLVRTSWCGGDPNWGRILCALGYSGASMDERRTDIGYSAPAKKNVLFGFRRGAPTHIPLKRLAAITGAPEFDVHVDLHRGQAGFVFYASDLTEEYVTFNKGDITDPKSLGG